MKRKLLFIFSSLLLILSTLLSSHAAENGTKHLYDNANLLAFTEKLEIESLLYNLSEKHDLDIVIVTTDSCENKSPRAYADDFYDENGFSDDGVLLLISMYDSDWYISTAGYGITAFTDAGIDYLADRFVPFLSNELYFDAFSVFIQDCDNFIYQANMGEPYDIGTLPKAPFDAATSLLISLVIGFIIAFIITGVMKSSLTPVKLSPHASSYIKDGSLEITNSRDFFLYRNITRTPKASSSGGGSKTHRSSSGRSHGGRGGKF